jgi:hypothetical protein
MRAHVGRDTDTSGIHSSTKARNMMAGENGYYPGSLIKSQHLPYVILAALFPIAGHYGALNGVVVFGVNRNDCDWHSGLR